MGLDEFLMSVIFIFKICSLMKCLDIIKMVEFVDCVLKECDMMEEVFVLVEEYIK